MTSETPTPEQVQEQVSKMLDLAEQARRSMLSRAEAVSRQEAQALLQERRELLRTVPPDDPRALSLQSSAAAARQAAEFAGRTLRLARQGRDVDPSAWVVMGRLADAADRPLAGVTLELIADKGGDRTPLGEVVTDDNGEFFASFPEKQFEPVFERSLDLFVTSKDEDGQVFVIGRQLIEPYKNRLHSFDIRRGLDPQEILPDPPDQKPTRKKPTRKKPTRKKPTRKRPSSPRSGKPRRSPPDQSE